MNFYDDDDAILLKIIIIATSRLPTHRVSLRLRATATAIASKTLRENDSTNFIIQIARNQMLNIDFKKPRKQIKHGVLTNKQKSKDEVFLEKDKKMTYAEKRKRKNFGSQEKPSPYTSMHRQHLYLHIHLFKLLLFA